MADLHLSLKPPLFRSGEPDWLAAQERVLKQIKDLAAEHPTAPVVVCGDIFDKPSNPEELINWAIVHMPTCSAVPGNHDLWHHRYADKHKTTYWVLVNTMVVRNLRPGEPTEVGRLVLHGFPCGFPLQALPKRTHDLAQDVAVVHAYCWTPGYGYQGAPEEERMKYRVGGLQGYDAIAFGDNHKGFICNQHHLCNCGSPIRRSSDEREYRPGVGLLLSDGTWKRHILDTSLDVVVSESLTNSEDVQIKSAEQFVAGLMALAPTAFDFKQAVVRWMKENTVSADVKQIIMQWLG